MEVKDIPISKITISDLNVRKNLDAGHEDSTLNDLAESIRENGLLNPITVIQKGDLYELVVGQRRFLACQSIGFDSIPAIIRDDISDADGVTLSLIENVHRANMHPIDKGRALQILYDTYESYKSVSKESGLSTPTIKRYMALLNLAPSIQEKLSTRDGPAGIGTLSALAELFPNPEDQLTALENISGFTQKVQLQILKQSEGDIKKLEMIRESAIAGEFDINMCQGIDECPLIPDELRDQINSITIKARASYLENLECAHCGLKAVSEEISEEEGGGTLIKNLIGHFIDEKADPLMQVDLCDRCDKLYLEGKISLTAEKAYVAPL